MPKVTIWPCGRGFGSAPAGLAEFLGVAHDMVGGQHQHECVAIAFGREHRRDRNRGTGIAAHRLEHDVGFDAVLAQLLGHDEAEVGIGDDDRPGEQARHPNARKHLLEGRSFPDKRNELLRHALARDRP